LGFCGIGFADDIRLWSGRGLFSLLLHSDRLADILSIRADTGGSLQCDSIDLFQVRPKP